MEFVYAFLFGILNPLAAALITGIWLILVVRFGILPLLLQRSQMSAERKKRIVRSVTRPLGIGIIGLLVMPFVCFTPDRLWNLGMSIVGEESFTPIFGFLYGPVWLVLVVEGWLVLLCYFGLCYLLNLLKVPIDRHQRINRYAVMAMLTIGILTGLIGSCWWIFMANAHWNRLAEASRFGLVVLSPTLVLLTAGMLVMLPISLVKALSIEGSNGASDQVSRNMTVTLLSAVMLLGAVGGIWSTLLYRNYW